jgi:hypothetical protein
MLRLSASRGWSLRQRSGLQGCTGCCCFTPRAARCCRARSAAPLDASLGLAGQTEAAPFLLGLAVLTLLTDRSRSRLLVCLIDDAHWLDQESAQVLAFVARRLRGERILMLFAARDQPLGSVFSGIPELAVRALGIDDAVELLLAAVSDQRAIAAARGSGDMIRVGLAICHPASDMKSGTPGTSTAWRTPPPAGSI